MDEKNSPIDVLIITAVKDELDVVCKAFEPDWQEQKDSKGFSYYTRKVIGTQGNEFTIAAARPIDMGGDFATNIATRLVNELKPRCLAMVGICAGWREKVFLGDVIVADRVLSQYTFSAASHSLPLSLLSTTLTTSSISP